VAVNENVSEHSHAHTLVAQSLTMTMSVLRRGLPTSAVSRGDSDSRILTLRKIEKINSRR
jgi:hypothetical protein